ncbi:MAG TPA: hypothetical protein VK543_04415 [Puia sp.]|nr:hypothetical protein [Puia sp.]
MKSKSTSAIIRSIKSGYKKVGYAQAANAIEQKLQEIKKNSKDREGKEISMALFGHLA